MALVTLLPFDVYDVDEWDGWLGCHGFKIEDVYQVDIQGDGRVTVHRYARALDSGRVFIDPDKPDEPMRRDPVTITPEFPLPAFTSCDGQLGPYINGD